MGAAFVGCMNMARQYNEPKKNKSMLFARFCVCVVAWWCSAGTCLAFELHVQAASFRRAPGAGGWGIGCARSSLRIIAPGTRRAPIAPGGLAGHVQWQMMDRRTVAARAGLLAGAALCGADPVLADATARRPPPAARLAGRLDQVRGPFDTV
jgi:hypothetical protein